MISNKVMKSFTTNLLRIKVSHRSKNPVSGLSGAKIKQRDRPQFQTLVMTLLQNPCRSVNGRNCKGFSKINKNVRLDSNPSQKRDNHKHLCKYRLRLLHKFPRPLFKRLARYLSMRRKSNLKGRVHLEAKLSLQFLQNKPINKAVAQQPEADQNLKLLRLHRRKLTKNYQTRKTSATRYLKFALPVRAHLSKKKS